ncbi:Autophagy-related protein 9 [Debaryomyces fabryi]|uniref:Autophagy-related protein 9 n=1 Tax=Debaryomyces fabryi TaxID=58627 RepID=A0A0V1PYX6_9ASCO|nr:Autophagy-related protein 9 [Debaryomyces fabryi]KSA01424.1 Autophagy-related protein 9 [Debaryomyces fabryi]CUM57301.1 unnamed protein product [Debaryomyces fabryi]
MSEYNQNSNNDTFLSRVFGLHSVYNQLQDEYQYYDPDVDYQQSFVNGGASSSHVRNEGNENANNGNTHLLDSESDLDSSLSLSSPPSPIVAFTGKEHNPIEDSAQVHWDTTHPHYGQDDDITASIPNDPPKKNMVDTAKTYINNKLHPTNGSLPMYNQPQQFRRPQPEGPSAQTIYQKKQHKSKKKYVIPPKERALYLWANITNMDEFLTDVYYYYRGNGMLNIVLTRLVDLLILIFILSFTVFLKWGINYDFFVSASSERTSITLKDLIIPNFLSKKVPLSVKLLLLGFSGYIVLRLVQLYFDYNYKLKEVKNFYHYLIGIPNDDELMTISWIVIVERLMALKDYNSLTSTNTNIPAQFLNDLNSKVRLNAHDIANRIMRKENYIIALINKEVLDLSLSMPFSSKLNSFLSNKSVLTKTLEWNIKLCINNFIFNQHGQINSNVLKDFNRNQLSKELSARFKMAAIINLLLCPFIVIYFVLLYFFRYFNEYKSNPSSILGLRQYTPWAEWKLREFNELPHFFIKRLHLSIGPANIYINQFPRGFLVINLMNFVNFVSGAITAILVLMGLWFDNEEHNFWSFEITENKSSLFYISMFGTVWAITSSSLTSTNSNTSENLNSQTSSFFYDPEASLRYVSQFTHYLPSSWNGRLHTVQVKNEFCELFSLKIIIIINEILSLILTPFILWFKVLSSSGAIIDFFREYSIHVDGLGYVCYFAMFNFEQKDKNMMMGLNKPKRKPKKSKITAKKKAALKTKNLSDDIELDNVVLNKVDKSKLSDSETSSESDDNDDADINNDYYQDEKMIKSYMYFLETCGNDKAKQASKLTTNALLPTKPSRIAKPDNTHLVVGDPSPSLLYQPLTSNSMDESSYNVNYNIEEQEEESSKGKRSGVLGMINQFYKHDRNR